MSLTISLPTPHPGQQRIDDCPTRHRIVMCGRRWGKSTWLMMRVIQGALSGAKIGLFTPSHKYSLDHWRYITNKLRPIIDELGGRISEQEKRIELPSSLGGGTVDLWSCADNEDPARGRSYDVALVDEGGLIPNLQRIWEAAIEPTLIDRRGRGIIVGTPKGAQTDFNRLFLLAESGGDDEWAAFRGHTTDNIYIPNVGEMVERARRRAESRGTLDLWRQEYQAVPADDGSSAIGISAIRDAVTERSELPTVAWGVDLAKSVDWTVAIGLDVLGRWTQVERWQGDWRSTKRRLLDLIGRETPVLIDSTGVGNPIVEDLAYSGMNVSGYAFSRKSRGVLIEDLRAAIHGKKVGIPAGQVQAELESLGVEHNPETGFTRYAVPGSQSDDCIMALALAWRCFSYEAPVPEWGPEKRELPWEPNIDAALVLEDAADDAFSSLGDGW